MPTLGAFVHVPGVYEPVSAVVKGTHRTLQVEGPGGSGAAHADGATQARQARATPGASRRRRRRRAVDPCTGGPFLSGAAPPAGAASGPSLTGTASPCLATSGTRWDAHRTAAQRRSSSHQTWIVPSYTPQRVATA